jgi:hypothetical protein
MKGKLLLLMVLPVCSQAQESVRQQLVHEHEQEGLTLSYVNAGEIDSIDYGDRLYKTSQVKVESAGRLADGAVSRDGELIAFRLSYDHPYRNDLGVAHSDGSDLREYPGVDFPSSFCWSSDKSKLAVNAASQRRPHGELLIVGLESEATQDVDEGGYTTSQCWSPGDKEIVYGYGDSVRVFDLGAGKSREIAKGEDPTWSPDGKWIAFHSGDAYYVVQPSGAGLTELFKQEGIRTGLWWSPDGSVVAYISLGGKLPASEHTFPFGPRQLRVRRLADNSDDWILVEPDAPYVPSYQWVLPGASNTH